MFTLSHTNRDTQKEIKNLKNDDTFVLAPKPILKSSRMIIFELLKKCKKKSLDFLVNLYIQIFCFFLVCSKMNSIFFLYFNNKPLQSRTTRIYCTRILFVGMLLFSHFQSIFL